MSHTVEFSPFSIITNPVMDGSACDDSKAEKQRCAIDLSGHITEVLGIEVDDSPEVALALQNINRVAGIIIGMANPQAATAKEHRSAVELKGIIDGVPGRGVTFTDPSRITPEELSMFTGFGPVSANILCNFVIRNTESSQPQTVQNTNMYCEKVA